jgi:hypothetical protein
MSREDIPTIEEQLESAEEILKEISREIEFIRRQEFIMRDKSDTTRSRITWFSWVSIIVLLVTFLWQLRYLREFFTSKKLL